MPAGVGGGQSDFALNYALFFQFKVFSYRVILDEVKIAKNLTYKPGTDSIHISDASIGRYCITFTLVINLFLPGTYIPPTI